MLVPRAMPKLSEDSQRLPEKRLSLSQPVGGAEQQGQVVEAGGHFGVLRAEVSFHQWLARSAEKRLGLAVLGSIFEPKTKIVHYPRGFGL
jgi:hypothetical protein